MPEPTPDHWRATLTELGLVVTGLFVGIVVLFVLRAVALWPSSTRGVGLVSGPTVTAIAALFYLFAHRRLEPVAAAVHAPTPRVGLAPSVIVTLVGIGLALGGSMMLGALLELLGRPVAEQPGILEIVAAWHSGEDRVSMIVLGISAVVFAPIAEECLFRGLLFARLRRWAGRPLAYVASALGFAAIHANLDGFVVYAWLGLVFAFVLERSGRLAAPVLVHMGNNAFAFAALLLGPGQ